MCTYKVFYCLKCDVEIRSEFYDYCTYSTNNNTGACPWDGGVYCSLAHGYLCYCNGCFRATIERS